MSTFRKDSRWARYGAIVLLSLVIAGLAGFYILHRSRELSARFTERAELFALALADRAALYLAQGREDELRLLLQTVALGNVLYVQVGWDGELIAERGPLAAELQLEEFDSIPSSPMVQRRSVGELHYLEVIRPLPRLDMAAPEGYIRVGTSLAPLARDIRGEALFIAGLALFLVTVGSALILYLTRPTAIEQLKQPTAEPQAERPILQLDDTAKRVLLRGEEVELSPREYELIKLLASAPGRVFSNREILEAVWKGRGFATASDVKQYIYLLRRKLEEDPSHPKLILTVRGFGYKLNPEAWAEGEGDEARI